MKRCLSTACALLVFPAAALSGPVTLTNGRDPAAPLALTDQHALTQLLAPFVQAADRSAAADAVLAHYQTAGWPVTEVEVMPGKDGGLEVSILEGCYGRILVEGGTPSQRRAVAASWQEKPGAPLTMPDVMDGLAWLHRNPLHAVTASFAPGTDPATADTVLTLQSDAMFRFFTAWQNDGIQPLGDHRLRAGVEMADLFGLPLWAVAEAFVGDDPDAYQAARGSLRAFLSWQHELRLTGQWTRGRAEDLVPGFTSSSEVDTWFTSARYLIPGNSGKEWKWELGVGLDFFRTSSQVAVEELQASAKADALHLTLENTLTRSTSTSSTGLRLEATWSPGGVSDQGADADFEALRRGASADYFIARGQAWYRQEFTRGWSLTGQTGGQWSNEPLLPAQAFSPAGAHTVRGFPEASVLGDNGIWGGLEAAAPALQAASLTLQPVAFLEAGYVEDQVTGDHTTLAGSGIGLRLQWSTHAFITADYGWRLTEPGGRAHLAVRLEF